MAATSASYARPFCGSIPTAGCSRARAKSKPRRSHIHGRIHADLKCLLHTHVPYATALTSLAGARLEPINQNALRFTGQIAYDNSYCGLARDPEEGDRLAAVLGDRRVLFMANYGVTTSGPSVAAAFDDLDRDEPDYAD